MHSVPNLAAGIHGLPSAQSAFAATQAAWRFLGNDRVTLPALVEPLREIGRQRVRATRAPFALLVHDWCKIGFAHPAGKRDVLPLTHAADVGYDLTTALLVDADHGQPLAPMEMHLKTANGVLSTRAKSPGDRPHLEQLLPTMRAGQTWGLDKPLVHVIDREADSVDHYRAWDAAGFRFLVRADNRRVLWHGKSRLLSQIRTALGRGGHFRAAGEALYHGRPACLWIAEAAVVLHRPAKKNVRGVKFERPGRPLPVRFIVAQVRDAHNQKLAEWLLLSNVPHDWAATELLARCYYWRWLIESLFKLLKSHGQQLEYWQQETGPAIARRLLIAVMACAVVWQLQADPSPAATEFKDVLVRLSGRQTKRKRPHTAPALLTGLRVLLSMQSLLEHMDLKRLRDLADQFLPLNTG